MATGTTVRCGIAIPQDFIGGPLHPDSLRAFLTRAEILGYESAWVQEQIVGTVPILEPVTVLTYAAALTRTMRLGTSVMVFNLRNPIQLAKSLTSLDHLSQGRLTVGIGIGGQTSEYAAFGLTPERRVRRFVEGIEVMKALWTEPAVKYAGEIWRLEGISQEPKPVQQPHPPLWFGARQPAALRRAVRLGDGFMGAGSSSTQDFQNQAQLVRSFLDDAKRDPATFAISKRVYLAVDDDRTRAERRLQEWFGVRYRNADLASQVAVWGSVGECLDRLAAIVQHGAQHLLLNPAFDYMEQMEILAQEIVPHLPAASRS
ncbi:MAG TPA: LLM class flavin-dependent oxidoreductase [Alphaproteobacteria bacterium]|nr:LLM class flavin-dependent oxidoreductase [Alphaproteobacteria bacterium]